MITKVHRFHGRNSLRSVYQHGQTVRVSHLALKFIANDRRKQWRAAVVVAKKVHKSAVVRNRIRRRIYASVGRQLNDDSPVFDLVFTVFHENISEMPADELEQMVAQLLSRAGILAPKPQQSKTATHDMIEGKE